MNYVILTDSCSDLGKEMRERIDVHYVKMSVTSPSGEIIEADLDWQKISYKEYYDRMRAGETFKSSQVSIESFLEEYRKHLEKGLDILYIAASSGLSGSISASVLAKNMIAEEFPDRKIICIDSLNGTLGQGLLVFYAANMRKDGKSIDEVADWVEKNKKKINQAGTVEDLVYLKRAGRVTGAAAFMSTVFNIKPILISNRRGENESIKKIVGRKNSFREIANMVKERAIKPEEQTIFIVHADCAEDAALLEETIRGVVKVKDVYVGVVDMAVGSTTGPGMISAFYYGKEVE